VPRRPRLTFQDNALLDPTKQAALLDRAKQIGGTGVQQDVMWGDVRNNGQYDWTKLDALVHAANARGLAPQFRLMGSSSVLQRRNPAADMALNTRNPNANLMGQFARDVAAHYGGQVSKYSVWNEPNLGPWMAQGPHTAAKQYRRLYQAAYAGIKAANPNAKVGFGEFVATSPEDHTAKSELGFMNAVLSAGNKPLRADYVAIHPYQGIAPGKVTAQQRKANPLFGGISWLPETQGALSDAFRAGRIRTASGKRPTLNIGEYGYQHSWVPNAHTRAQYMSRAMQMARDAKVGSVNLYQLLPTANRASEWDSSILDAQGRIDPAMAAALKRLRRG
jgi:hypothetical protein